MALVPSSSRGGGGGGAATPRPWFIFTTNVTTSILDYGYLTWHDGGGGAYPGSGPNPFDLTVPTQPVVLADGNYDIAYEVECDEAHAATMTIVVYLDIDGVSDGPGLASVPLDSGFTRVMLYSNRYLAAGMKIGVSVQHSLTGTPIPFLLWAMVSWEPT